MPGASLTVDTSLPSPSPASPPTRRAWFGATVLGVAVVAACWLGAMLYWRAAGGTPSGMAIAQLLVALPAGMLLSLWMGKSALSARAGTATAPAQSAAATAADARKLLPGIAAAAVRMRGAESVAELAETLLTNAYPCTLDPELLDDAGYPVLSGRAACADPGAARETMAPWLAQRGIADLDFSDEGWRALSMAAAVTAELAQHALLHPKLQAWLPEYLAATKSERADHALPMLQLLPVLPASWQAGQRQAAADWLRRCRLPAEPHGRADEHGKHTVSRPHPGSGDGRRRRRLRHHRRGRQPGRTGARRPRGAGLQRPDPVREQFGQPLPLRAANPPGSAIVCGWRSGRRGGRARRRFRQENYPTRDARRTAPNPG
jgi:hypothetical protein